MKKAFVKIYAAALYSSLIVSIFLIVNSSGGFWGNDWIIPGFFLYMLSGGLIILKLLYNAVNYEPDNEYVRGFYTWAWKLNFIADFVFVFFICGFGRVEKVLFPVLIALYIIVMSGIDLAVHKKSSGIKINKALLWPVIIIMLLFGISLCRFVDLKYYER